MEVVGGGVLGRQDSGTFSHTAAFYRRWHRRLPPVDGVLGCQLSLGGTGSPPSNQNGHGASEVAWFLLDFQGPKSHCHCGFVLAYLAHPQEDQQGLGGLSILYTVNRESSYSSINKALLLQLTSEGVVEKQDLASWLGWLSRSSASLRIASSIPTQGTSLGCGSGPQ